MGEDGGGRAGVSCGERWVGCRYEYIGVCRLMLLGLGLGRSANASEASVSATSAKQPTGDRVHPTAAFFAI